MNMKHIFLILSLISHPGINANTDNCPEQSHRSATIPLNKMALHVDDDDIRLEMKKLDPTNPLVRMTYIISGGIVLTATIVAAVILIVHFNQ